MTRLIVMAVMIVFAIYLALPSFFLKKAVGRETMDSVTERLGQPLQSKPKPGTLSVTNTYRVGFQPPLCVDYLITFEQKVTEDTGVRPLISAWDWKFCGIP